MKKIYHDINKLRKEVNHLCSCFLFCKIKGISDNINSLVEVVDKYGNIDHIRYNGSMNNLTIDDCILISGIFVNGFRYRDVKVLLSGCEVIKNVGQKTKKKMYIGILEAMGYDEAIAKKLQQIYGDEIKERKKLDMNNVKKTRSI